MSKLEQYLTTNKVNFDQFYLHTIKPNFGWNKVRFSQVLHGFIKLMPAEALRLSELMLCDVDEIY